MRAALTAADLLTPAQQEGTSSVRSEYEALDTLQWFDDRFPESCVSLPRFRSRVRTALSGGGEQRGEVERLALYMFVVAACVVDQMGFVLTRATREALSRSWQMLLLARYERVHMRLCVSATSCTCNNTVGVPTCPTERGLLIECSRMLSLLCRPFA
jgi:hypothetical protein